MSYIQALTEIGSFLLGFKLCGASAFLPLVGGHVNIRQIYIIVNLSMSLPRPVLVGCNHPSICFSSVIDLSLTIVLSFL